MADKNHLPMYGVGPVYVGAIIMITAAAVIMGQCVFLRRAGWNF